MKKTLVAATLVAACLPAHAASEWRYSASIYGYLLSLDGSTTFPASEGGSSVGLDAETIMDALKFNFSGTFEASNGRWGIWSDVFYADLGEHKSGTREFSLGGIGLPAGATANVNYDLKATEWTIAGTWRLSTSATTEVDLVAGARLLDLSQRIRFELEGNVAGIPAIDREGTRRAQLENWDGIVGIRGRFALGDSGQWYVPFHFDIGAGNSDLTWQAAGGIGYRFGWGDVIAVYRYLDYDFKSGGDIKSLATSGPAIGAVFRW